jgi:hypothetical protein
MKRRQGKPMTPAACPIPTTHGRLSEAHRLWHQALDAYSDPASFRTQLNATIQALRNVTFMLQAEKERITGFDEWYETWRVRAREDVMLRWLHDARTRVVKQGDLDTRSVAHVSVKLGWDSPPVKELDVAPSLTAAEIAAAEAAELNLPDEIDGLLVVERRWVASDLPDHEVLDALASCYGELAHLVAEAHERCGQPMEINESDPDDMRGLRPERLGGRLPCMVASVKQRTATIELRTGDLVEVQRQETTYDPVVGREAAERYGLLKLKVSDPTDPFAWAEAFAPHARRVLLLDGYHMPILFLIMPGPEVSFSAIPNESRANRLLLWQEIADEVERTDATGLVTIGEVWTGTRFALDHDLSATDDPFRGEGLMITAASNDGRARATLIPFFRRLGRIFTRRPAEVELLADAPSFLDPVLKVWGAKRERGA